MTQTPKPVPNSEFDCPECGKDYADCNCVVHKTIGKSCPAKSVKAPLPAPKSDVNAPSEVFAYAAKLVEEAMRPAMEILRKAPEPTSGMTKERVREIFMKHGFTIKEGQTDLKPYVYEAASAIANEAVAISDQRSAWILRQIAQLDPRTGSICTAVMMAREWQAAHEAQQKRESK